MSGKWCFFSLSFCCFPAKCFWAAKQFASNRKVFFNQSDQFVKNWYIRCNHIAQILTSGGLEVIALWSNEQCTSKEVCILLRVNKWPRAHLIRCQGSLSLQVLCYFFFLLPFALPFFLHMENLYQDGCHGNRQICMCLICLFKYLLMVYNYHNTALQSCSLLI